jgi:hypothetical protein
MIYELDDKTLRDNYGTVNGNEVAEIDKQNFEDDPGLFIGMAESDINITVEQIGEVTDTEDNAMEGRI